MGADGGKIDMSDVALIEKGIMVKRSLP